MICARGVPRAVGPTVSRVRPVGIIDAVGFRCLRSRDHRQKARVRPAAERELRMPRRLPWKKYPLRSRPQAVAGGPSSSARHPVPGHGDRGRSRSAGARAFPTSHLLRGSYDYAHEHNIAGHRPLDLGGAAFLRACPRSPGRGPGPFAQLLGVCDSPWPDADHGGARATITQRCHVAFRLRPDRMTR